MNKEILGLYFACAIFALSVVLTFGLSWVYTPFMLIGSFLYGLRWYRIAVIIGEYKL